MDQAPARTISLVLDVASLSSLQHQAAAACVRAVGRILLAAAGSSPSPSCSYTFGDSRLLKHAATARWKEICHRREPLPLSDPASLTVSSLSLRRAAVQVACRASALLGT